MAWTAEQFRAHYADRKAMALAQKGARCVRCGGTDGLDFHHPDKASKLANLTTLLRCRIEVIEAELEKCILLCRQCHSAEHWPEAKGHGSHASYRRGCRCEVCVTFNRSYMAGWRKSRRTGRPRGGQRGEDSGSAVLTWESVRKIRERLASGQTNAAIAAAFSVNPATISLIKTGKTWTE